MNHVQLRAEKKLHARVERLFREYRDGGVALERSEGKEIRVDEFAAEHSGPQGFLYQ